MVGRHGRSRVDAQRFLMTIARLSRSVLQLQHDAEHRVDADRVWPALRNLLELHRGLLEPSLDQQYLAQHTVRGQIQGVQVNRPLKRSFALPRSLSSVCRRPVATAADPDWHETIGRLGNPGARTSDVPSRRPVAVQ